MAINVFGFVVEYSEILRIAVCLTLLTYLHSYIDNRHIPGPLVCKFSGIWATWHRFKRDQPYAITELHQKYGHVVLYSPGCVSVSTRNGFEEIYGTRDPMRKSTMYNMLRFFDCRGNLTPASHHNSLDWKPMVHRKRTISKILSRSSLLSMYNELLKVGQALELKISQLCSQNSDEPTTINAQRLFSKAAFDGLYSLTFGLESASVLDDLNKPVNPVLANNKYRMMALTIRQRIGMPLLYLFSITPFQRFNDIANASMRMFNYGIDRVDEYVKKASLEQNLPRSIMSEMLKDREIIDQPHHRDILAAESLTLMIAGHETTATTLTYLFYELAKNKEIQFELHALLIGIDHCKVVEFEKVMLLENVIKETMRLYSVTPGGLDRTTSRDWNVEGNILPKGTTVVSQLHTLMHDEAVFKDPESWRPSRWNSATAQMRDHWLPFIIGMRQCPGRGLAMMEIMLYTTIILQKFEVDLAKGTEDHSMKPVCIGFMMYPGRDLLSSCGVLLIKARFWVLQSHIHASTPATILDFLNY